MKSLVWVLLLWWDDVLHFSYLTDKLKKKAVFFTT